MPGQISFAKDPNAAKKAAIEAAKAKAKPTPTAEDGAIMKFVKPSEVKDRMRVSFDDSGSMSGQIETAKDGVIEFMRNCIPNQTAVAVHFLCSDNEDTQPLENLQTDLPQASIQLKKANLNLGGTPLFENLNKVVKMELTTRIIAFTDGSPTDDILPAEEAEKFDWSIPRLERWKKNADIIIAQAIEKKIPIDTVFFGSEYRTDEMALLKYFADMTHGFFLHFDPKKVNFRTAFKYLSPGNRKLLADKSFVADLEAGKKN